MEHKTAKVKKQEGGTMGPSKKPYAETVKKPMKSNAQRLKELGAEVDKIQTKPKKKAQFTHK